MSQTQETETEDRVDDTPPVNEDVERVARANGWKPRDQWKGKAEEWKTADVFVALGLENPAVLNNRNAFLADKVDRLERLHGETRRDLTAKLDDALSSLTTVTQMTRSAEQRAYDRARRELKEEQARAVESGDTVRYQALDRQVDELDKSKPVDPPPRTPPAAATPPTPTNTEAPPEVRAFFDRNPWYHRDRELQIEADIIHTGLRTARPDLTPEQNLAEVERRMKVQFGDRIAPTSRSIGNGAERTQVRNDDTDRREDAPMVTPSGGGSPRRAANRFTFDSMPKESKDAFTKYKKQLEGHGEPLTEKEWATTYWDQFRDDGV